MRTTLVLDDGILSELRQEAARCGMTMSALVAEALRAHFQRRSVRRELPPLPTFSMGEPAVDIANREALEGFLERHDRRDERLYGRGE